LQTPRRRRELGAGHRDDERGPDQSAGRRERRAWAPFIDGGRGGGGDGAGLCWRQPIPYRTRLRRRAGVAAGLGKVVMGVGSEDGWAAEIKSERDW
jgi:hypothetical protein